MICIPLNKKQANSLIRDFSLAQKIADLTEIWFDELNVSSFKTENIHKILLHKTKPVIYKSSGDLAKITKILDFNKLSLAAASDLTKQSVFQSLEKHLIDFIDLDLKTNFSIISKIKKEYPDVKIILSFHDFKKTPSETKLLKISQNMIHKGADIIKIATMANNTNDSLRMLGFLSALKLDNHQPICLCMGKYGKITRQTGHLFGNYLMYAPLKLTNKTAPGQIAVKQLKQIINQLNQKS